MAWRVANTRARAEAGRRTPQGPKDQPTSAPGGDYQSARARRERAEAEKAELDLAERKGELKRVEQVRAPIAAALLSLREGLLQLPKRLAPQLVAEQDQSLIERKLDTEIRAQLAKAATLEATDGRA